MVGEPRCRIAGQNEGLVVIGQAGAHRLDRPFEKGLALRGFIHGNQFLLKYDWQFAQQRNPIGERHVDVDGSRLAVKRHQHMALLPPGAEVEREGGMGIFPLPIDNREKSRLSWSA